MIGERQNIKDELKGSINMRKIFKNERKIANSHLYVLEMENFRTRRIRISRNMEESTTVIDRTS